MSASAEPRLRWVVTAFAICLASCGKGEVTDGDEREVMCRGTVTFISIPPSGNAIFRLKLQSGSACATLLPPGVNELTCQVLPTEREGLEWVLRKLRIGDFVTVWGLTNGLGIRRAVMMAIF